LVYVVIIIIIIIIIIKFSLEQATKAQRGSRGIVLLFLTSALDGVGGQRHAPTTFTPGKDPIPIV
jgi:hypothetical protein